MNDSSDPSLRAEDSDVLLAEVVVPPMVVASNVDMALGVRSPGAESEGSAIEDAETTTAELLVESPRSWVFRWGDSCSNFLGHLFGIASVLMMLAVTASIPIIQFASFGYLLEVSGRLARGQRFRDAMVGLRKARVAGSIVLGTWICLLPIRLVSNFWFEAYVIDPTSSQTAALRIGQIVLIVLTLGHIAAAMICGGKLRYFFWPLVAPFSLLVWSTRRLAGAPGFRQLLNISLGWISKSLPADICQAKPIRDWFLPAIVWNRVRRGNLYSGLRDGVWDFFAGLRPTYYFTLGAKGFLGTFLWLLIPTGFLVISSFSEGGVALLTFLAGVMFAIPVFSGLPFIQAHFAREGRSASFLQPGQVWKNFGRAPLAHVIALLVVLVLALPLFLLKIESIPAELLWTLSLVFVLFSWPTRMIVGWAYRRGMQKEKLSRWWFRYPMVITTIPISFAFVLIFTGTRYVSWHGAISLFENHVFLLPAPFWL